MYAGIDLGGTNIAAGLAKADGAIIKKISVPLGNAKNDPDEVASLKNDSGIIGAALFGGALVGALLKVLLL